jgi:hypothetical protein
LITLYSFGVLVAFILVFFGFNFNISSGIGISNPLKKRIMADLAAGFSRLCSWIMADLVPPFNFAALSCDLVASIWCHPLIWLDLIGFG